MKTKIAILLVATHLTLPALASEPSANQSAVSTNEAQHENQRSWVAVPASYLVGFGLGQAIQGQYKEYGWVFTAADIAGAGLLIGSLGDCRDVGCQDRKTNQLRISAAVLTISRLAQISDTLIRATRSGNSAPSPEKPPVGLRLVPSTSGAEIQLAATF